MRRVGIFLAVVIALVAMVGPASAQPKVTITGFVDNLTTWDRNMSVVDINPARTGDAEWYSRTRVRPDITAEVGTTKFVLGLEIDSVWGQTGANDGSANANPGGGPQRSGALSGWDLNTDVSGVIEVKWAYTEFNVPLIPVPTRLRVGAQPWEATYKLATLANGDFAGAHLTMQALPILKWNFTYAQIEESSTGIRDGFPRGDDFAIVTSVEISPFKGLDIRPIFSYANYEGVTSGSSRQGRGGVGTGANIYPGPSPVGGATQEHRFTVGFDARWRFGPFSLDPTFFYQFGGRDQVCLAANAAFCVVGGRDHLDISAFLVDIRGGWQAGPLLLEGAVIYTSGNKANERIDRNQDDVNFYQPISTDTSFFGGWAEIWALGIDYFNIIRSGATGVNPGVAIGYDKYGLIRVGARASYALTPAFTIRAAANANWTAEEVDTSSVLAAGTGLTPGDGSGDSRYLGTEINLGFQWRFAPNVAFDVVGAYMFAGNALSTHQTISPVTGAAVNGRNPQDIQAVTARVRYSW